MMTIHSFTDEKIQKIIRTYSLVHTLFFGLGSALIMIIISGVIGYMLFNHANQQILLVRNDESLVKENLVLESMQSTLNEYAKYEDMHLFIKQGHLSFEGDAIRTIDNLMTYKGLVIPRIAKIAIATPLPSLNMLTGTSYRSDDLNSYIQNTIMLYPDNPTLQNSGDEKELLQFGTSLIDYFGISCITTPKVTDYFCQQALYAMINILPVYDLSEDIVGLREIASSLMSTPSQDKFCAAIKQYVFFSHDISESIKNILYQCGKDYESFYTDFASFYSVQEQLGKQSINATISPNHLINAYKLISTQQSIYYEMSHGRINDARIRSYLKYNEELLRRSESIQSIYFDVIAWFNNQYMIPSLTRLYFQQKGQESSDIKGLLESIRMINEGSKLLGYSGLIQVIADQTLIAPRTQTVIGTGLNLPPLVDVFNSIYSFPHFIVNQTSSGEDDTLKVSGLWSRDADIGLGSKVPSLLTLRYDGVRFAVTHVLIKDLPRVEAAVNTLLQSQTMTIPELYDLLVRDGLSFNTTEVSLCDAIHGLSGYVSCTPYKIVFQGYPLASKKTLVTYTINHNNGILLSYGADNASLSQSLNYSLGLPQTTMVTMPLFIQSMLGYRQTISDMGSGGLLTGSADLIQAKQDILNLGAKVTTITASGVGLYTLSIVIKNIPCTITYDIATQSITSLTIVKDGKDYPIRGFSLSLTTMESSLVKSFILDPRTLMMQFDPIVVKKLNL